MENNRVLFAKLMKRMVGPNGFEPSTSSVSRKRSRPAELRACCSYRGENVERVVYSHQKQFIMPFSYFLTAHAMPSGPFPVAMWPMTLKLLRSTTATWLSGLTAT